MTEPSRRWSILETEADVRSNIIEKFDAFIFDMDGVVWMVDQAIKGSPEALKMLRDAKKEIFFATNNSLMRSSQYGEKLKRLDLGEYPEERIFSSSAAAALYLQSVGFKGKIYMIGPHALKEELERIKEVQIIDSSIHNGIFRTPQQMAREDIDTSIGAVVMGFDAHFNYYKAAYACAILCYNPCSILVYTNGDTRFPTHNWILPGTGAFVAAIQASTGKEGIVAGKPGPLIINQILKMCPHLKPERICMVGDNLLTDIDFGRRNGLGTVLVETGVHTRADLLSR